MTPLRSSCKERLECARGRRRPLVSAVKPPVVEVNREREVASHGGLLLRLAGLFCGFLTLVGRQHDLIIVSGYNVYPQVVERVLGECPGVRECAVFGVPDRQRGERVAAAIVRSDASLDEARLRAWLADRLVHYQQPREYVFLDSLPKNSLGKVLRRDLRNQLTTDN